LAEEEKRLKKANLCVWLIALMACPAIRAVESNEFSLYFYNSLKQRRVEQFTDYTISTFPAWQTQIQSRNTEDYRIDFNQTSRSSLLSLAMRSRGKILRHEFETGYEYLYDHSNVDSRLKPYSNKTGFLGYGATLLPLDSLRIASQVRAYQRNEQDRYIAAHQLASQGIFGKINANYSLGLPGGLIQIGGNAESKRMDWERYQFYSASTSQIYDAGGVSVSGFANASYRSDDLYVLTDYNDQNNQYKREDRQIRKSLNANFSLATPLGEDLDCQIADNYSLLNYRNKENLSRNSGDYNNQVSLNLVYRPSGNVQIRSNSLHDYYLKDLSHIKNTRIIESRNTNCGLTWEYNPYDSLSLDYSIELRRMTFPDTEHKLDNDYLTNMYKLGWTMFWKDRVRLANRLLYLKRDEVYINSDVSANNNTVGSLLWQPECDILLGDCLLLQQDYQLRADYGNYYYSEREDFDIDDTFYRQVSAGCNVIFDSAPLAAKVDLPKWNLLPYRTRNLSAFRIEAGFGWERNETYMKDGGVYNGTGMDESRTISLMLQKQFGIVICQVFPKYRWGSWNEYNLLLSTAWQVNQNSLWEIGLNPIGPELQDLDWKVYCSLNLKF
jgi:hypothetical protein